MELVNPACNENTLRTALEIFKDYSQNFEVMVNREDATIILPFFYLPSILITPGQDPILMISEQQVIGVFQQLISTLKARHFHHSKLTQISTKELSAAEAIISGTAIRYQDQAENQVLEELGFTYTLCKKEMAWKIIVGIIHGTEAAITFH